MPVNPYFDPRLPHHRRDGFQNIDPAARTQRGFSDLMRWRRERRGKVIPLPVRDLSVVTPDLDFIRGNRGTFAVTWIGHATALVQAGGVNFVTDPHFSQRASPVQWAGPRRWQAPGVALRDLPHIDVALISHNHFDHLDTDSVRALQQQAGGSPMFIVPLGLERWLASHGVPAAIALDWWQHVDLRDTRIELVPVQHWSRRTLADTNTTLWGGFVATVGGGKFFFAGDTGYSDQHFVEIGARHGPIDLALVPIGAYEPRWFMRPQHVNPEEAVRIHRDVRARRSLGIHWGTFQLTDEPLDQAVIDLEIARRTCAIDAADFFVLRHGATYVLN